MSKMQAQWYTPTARTGFRAEMYKKLEKCPILPPLPKRISYFNNKKKHEKVCLYDVAFNPAPGYDQGAHRDDRHRLSNIHENIFHEEKFKAVPVLTSLNYARPFAKRVDPFDTKYFLKVGVGAFYNKTGVNISPDLERQCIKMF